MKQLSRVLFFFCFVVACQNTDNQQIIVPKLKSGFYEEALVDLNRKLASEPGDDKLNAQKLYYCERLEWPITCLAALDFKKQKEGMTSQLADSYVIYFIKHKRYDLLRDFVDQWDDEFNLYQRNQKAYITGLITSGQYEAARGHLRDLLSRAKDSSALAFGARQHLILGDTTFALYHLAKLHKVNASHVLMYPYGLLLLDRGQQDRAFQALGGYQLKHPLSIEKSLEVAGRYSKVNLFDPAIRVLRPHCCQDTIAYMLSDLFRRSNRFDSSIMYLDSVIVRDPSNVKAFWKKGRAYEDRGWFSYATSLYEDLLALDSTYTEAQQRINLIQRKIAYLQRQKQEVVRPPTLELETIKLDN